MQVAATDTPARSASSRWSLAYAWLAGLAVYCVAILIADKPEATWINDAAWTISSGAAALACFRAARLVEPARRRAWFMFGIGCTSWFAGQLHWNYSQLVLRVDLPFPSIGQAFFSAFAPFAIAAVLWVSQRGAVDPLMGFTPVLKAFIATIIGGLGSLRGAVLGGFVLGGLEVGSELFLTPDVAPYRDAIVLLAVVALLVVKPEGLLPAPRAHRS